MAAPIEFYFDFSSPYSYIASEEVEAIAERHGRTVVWRPILLGAVFKASGGTPLTEGYGPKARYSVRDFARSAAFVGVPYRHPSTFPIGAVTAARSVLWLQRHHPDLVAPFIHSVFRAFFVADLNIADAAVVMELAQGLGIDTAQLSAGAQDESIKNALRTEVERAIARGVFGAPTLVIDGEMFWGHDRLAQVERWISAGSF
jgi:2-hydroxychromene-2-carboxylate isomerase